MSLRAHLLAFLLLILSGCDHTADTLNKIKAQAATPAGRAAATTSLLAEFPPKGSMLPGAAVDDAAALLEQASTNAALSTQATAYAGAVLDAVQTSQSNLQQGGEYEIFWMKVGRLAYLSAEEAFQAQREQEAATLMLAGGTRWQNEPYWLRYPNHDALIAIIMARSGKRDEAIQRLRSRSELSGEAARVLNELEGHP